jgi:hypothetical protein
MTAPNNSLTQKIAGVFVSGPEKHGEIQKDDHIPGR